MIQKGREWLQLFLKHVQQIQEMKKHHIHLPNEKGEKVYKVMFLIFVFVLALVLVLVLALVLV